jgi:uncharacterized protein YggU (UPF0235/DUF167 family)
MLSDIPSELLLDFLHEDERGVIFTVRVKPNATKEKLSINASMELTLSVRAKALENEANLRVKHLIAQIFDLAPSKVLIISGDKSRIKRILLLKVSMSEILKG